MELDRFIDAANLAHWNIFLSREDPYDADEYMAKVDEVLNAFNAIDYVALGAELIDGVNNEKEMQYRLKVIDAKLNDTNTLYYYEGKPYFTDEEKETINNIMGDEAYNYMSKWVAVTEVWHNLSCIVDETLCKMRELAGWKEPQQDKESNEPQQTETIEQFVQKKFDSAKDRALQLKLIEKDGSKYKWKYSQTLFAYFWAYLICGDRIEGEIGEVRWKVNHQISLKEYDGYIKALFSNCWEKPTQKARTTGASDFQFRAKGYEIVNRCLG